MKFKIKRSTDNQFYFVLIARNGQVVLTSETYTRKAACRKAITSLVKQVWKSIIVDETVK